MKIDKKTLLYILLIAISCIISAFLLNRLTIINSLEKDFLLTVLFIIFAIAVLSTLFNKTTILRLMITLISFALFFSVLFIILDKSGFWENVSTIESLKQFIKERGIFSSLIFVIIQILQVVAIPLPGAVTVSVGNIIFGAFWGSLLSYVGIIIGSVLAFIIGKKFGYKLVIWIAGEDNVKKLLNMIKGKDKIMFTMIFLLPFFPDDLLCFVAGLTSMSLFFFSGMAMVTRIVTIGATAFFTEFIRRLLITNSIFSYIILAVIGITLLLIFLFTVKHGEKIQSYFENLYNKCFHRNKTDRK